MKKLLLPAILLLSCITMAYRFKDVPSLTKKAIKKTPMTALALYGEYIFEREQCGSCHSENRKSQYQAFISLDGLAGKYPDDWHYLHLFSPQTVSPYSSMPSYPQLFKNELDYSAMKKWTKEATKKGDKNLQYTEKELFADAQNMYDKLKKAETVSEGLVKNKEIFALIAYLQQLSSSEEKNQLDSIETVKNQFAKALLFETEKKITLPLAYSNHKDTIAMGQPIFMNYCAVCHGKKGEGGIAPNLTDEYWLHGGSVEDILNIVQNGAPEKGMISWENQLSASEMGKVVCYIRSLKGSNPENAKAPQGEKQ